MSDSKSIRVDVELAGQKMAFMTSFENEDKLRIAARAVNDQISQITAGPNKSIERAALMTAVSFAAQIQDLQEKVKVEAVAENTGVYSEVMQELSNKLDAIEKQVDVALDSLSLPGSPRSIVP
jgi:cell division protein ZapA